jgi:hypothetical protein
LLDLRLRVLCGRCGGVWIRSGTVQKDDHKLIRIIRPGAGNLLAVVEVEVDGGDRSPGVAHDPSKTCGQAGAGKAVVELVRESRPSVPGGKPALQDGFSVSRQMT